MTNDHPLQISERERERREKVKQKQYIIYLRISISPHTEHDGATNDATNTHY